MEVLLFAGGLIALTWLFAAPHETQPRPSRDSLNEVCPNEGTGDFAYFPPQDLGQ
jgi:hypothetical protein